MSFKTGAVVGFAMGYYLGAKAGRERYEELRSQLRRLQDNPRVQEARDRAVEVAEKGAGRAWQAVEERLPASGSSGSSGTDTDTIVLDAQDRDAGIAVP